eukprot:5468570-Pleurochrysis_carterae.AAC.1
MWRASSVEGSHRVVCEACRTERAAAQMEMPMVQSVVERLEGLDSHFVKITAARRDSPHEDAVEELGR